MDGRAERLRIHAAARDYFFPGGTALQAGDRRRDQTFAQTIVAGLDWDMDIQARGHC